MPHSQSMEEPQLTLQEQGWIEDPRLAGRPPHEHDLLRNYDQASMVLKAFAESFHIYEEDVDREERIGEGQVGTVCRGRFRGTVVAIKDLKSGARDTLPSFPPFSASVFPPRPNWHMQCPGCGTRGAQGQWSTVQGL